jgi:TDG/mug DNA glycosylase family protein
LRAIFCGINPGRVSAAANAHFANPRNDFWRLLHAAGFTPRLYEPGEQFELLKLGIGATNAAYRTTPGSGDLRRADFVGSAERLEQIAVGLPRAIGFFRRQATGERSAASGARLRASPRRDRALRAPSTSPANAAVPWSERLRWFQAFYDLLR